MKGQAINIDWTVGLSLFLFASLSGIFFIGTADFGGEQILMNQASEIQENLIAEASSISYSNKIYLSTPYSIKNIPVDRKYSFRNSSSDWISENSFYMNSTSERIVTVADGNQTVEFQYLKDNTTWNDRSSDLSIQNNWINNTKISVKTDPAGVETVHFSGKEFFQDIEIDGNNQIIERNILADAFGDNLTVYNNSEEFVVKDQTFKATMDNYSELYWHPDGFENLAGTGVIKEGETSGFALQNSSKGIIFTGDMNAKITKPDSSTIEAEINSSKTRIRIHEKDNNYVTNRVENSAEGEIYTGVESKESILTRKKVNELQTLSNGALDARLDIENIEYNITVENKTSQIMSQGEEIPITDAVVTSRNLNIVSLNASINEAETRVGVWR